MKIKLLGDPVLRLKALRVESYGWWTRRQIKKMKEVLKESGGVGLAAPQVGISKRIFLFQRNNGDVEVITNPRISWHSHTQRKGTEGCLSIPDVYVRVKRYEVVTLNYKDEKGKEKTVTLHDMEARIAQHEIDHLNGVLIIDYEK